MSKALQIEILEAAVTKRKFQWGEEVEGFKFYACHDGQLDILASDAKFTAAFAGAQGGKTALSPLWMAQKIQKHTLKRKFRALVVSPSVPMRRQSQIVEHFESCYAGTPLAGKFNKSENTYHFNGGEILFRSATDPVSLDAGVYDAVIVDEAAKISKEAWDRIKVRASGTNAPVLMVSTPDVASCIYDEVYAATRPVAEGIRASADGKYFMRTWANIERPGYNLEAYEEAKRTMSSAMFARMYQGVFAHFEGLVYEVFGSSKDVAYPVIPTPARLPSPAMKTIGGVDFGFSIDPAAVLIGAVCEDGVIYVLDEIYKTGLNNDQLASEIIRLKSQWEVDDIYKLSAELRTGTTLFYCDTEDPKAIQALRQYQINATGKKVTDIVPSIATVNAMFRAGRLKVLDRCKNLVKELKAYQWEQGKSGEYKDKPKGKDDHLCDALRYMVGSYMSGKRITPLDLTTVLAPEEAERHAEAVNERLGHDPEEQRITALKKQTEVYASWLTHLANCEDN